MYISPKRCSLTVLSRKGVIYEKAALRDSTYIQPFNQSVYQLSIAESRRCKWLSVASLVLLQTVLRSRFRLAFEDFRNEEY